MAPALPPGPAAHPLRQAAALGRDPYGFFADCQREFGDVFTIRLPGDPPRVVLCDPAHIEDFIRLPATSYRSDLQSIHLNIGRNSVLFTDGERHRKQRQIMTPPLHGERLRSYAHTIMGVCDEFFVHVVPGEPRPIYPVMRDLTMEVLMRCVFGLDTRTERGASLKREVLDWLDAVLSAPMFVLAMALTANGLRARLDEATQRRTQRGWLNRLPALTPWQRGVAAKARLERRLRDDIARCRREGTEGRDDILAMLIDATYEDGEPMSDEDILDQLVTFLVGGHETTANSLCWALAHLCAAPEVVGRIVTELDATFAEGFEPARCGELAQLDAAIKESERLTPVAPAVSRTLVDEVELAGRRVPPNTIVWAAICRIQRHPDTWADPDTFDPTRFGPKAPRPNVFLPFGAGRRRCLGAAFAGYEMRIVLARLFDSFDLHPEAVADLRAAFRGLTVVPASGVPLRLTRRAPDRVRATA